MTNLGHEDARQQLDPVVRAVAIVGLAAVALIHLLDTHDTFITLPYKGWLYVALILGSTATAWRLLRHPDSAAWASSALLPLGAIVGFVISRTVGLPGAADDIGNWWEPLGLASLFVEGMLVAVSAAVLSERGAASVALRPSRNWRRGQRQQSVHNVRPSRSREVTRGS